MKKLTVMMVVTLGELFAASASMAATAYATAKVARTSTGANGETILMLADTAASPAWTGNTWWTVPTGADDQALATALTAMSLAKPVRITYDDTDMTVIVRIGLDDK